MRHGLQVFRVPIPGEFHWAMQVIWTALVVALLAGCVPSQELRIINYCDLPDPGCAPLAELPPEVQAQLVEQAWCCHGGDPCYPVDSLTDCAISDIAIYCEYGSSHPSSGPIGSGFECYVYD